MMKKFTLLCALMLCAILPAFSQVVWVVDGEELESGAEVTATDWNEDAWQVEFLPTLKNNGTANVAVYVYGEMVDELEGTFPQCCTPSINGVPGNCYPFINGTLKTSEFTIAAGEETGELHTNCTFDLTQYGTTTVKYSVRVQQGDPDKPEDDEVLAELTVNYTHEDAAVEGIAADALSARLNGSQLTLNGVKAGQQVKVIDLTGRIVSAFTISADGTATFDAAVGRGIYIIALTEGNAMVFTQKVIAE